MKRLAVLFGALLVVALVVPSVAMATEPIFLDPWSAPDPIPAHAPLVVGAGWLAVSRGLAMSAPTHEKWFFTIWDEQGSVVLECTTADSADYWVPGVELIEDTGWPKFNTKIGAKEYLKKWRYPIADGLPAGHYSMTAGGVQTRVAFDLYWYFDGQHAPMKLLPGEFIVWEDWEFTVQ